MKKLLLFLPVVIFLSSCTITKRVHRKGYHVSSNSNINIKKKKRPHKTVGYSKKKGTKHLNEKNKIRKDSVVDNNPTNLRVLKSDLPNSSNTNKKNSKKIEIHNVKSTGLREKNESPKTFILNEISEKKTNNEEGITNEAGMYSVIFAVLSCILIFPSLLALILGAKGMKQNKQNPGKYKDTWMAKTGFIVGLIGTTVMGIALALFAYSLGGILFYVLAGLCGVVIIASVINVAS